ncbi:glutathione S-transferase family protein [Luteimonas sp. R10]|uniref:glutathione S-transferase family protein n=1 Tax=Luteimonas sp. R10 TaxID=3108176 RepID=UPI00309049A1|nr:glutathione S-transferase family protein [Luteimonas sp. R10]
MSLTLYAAPMSSATPVVCALAELDIPCEIVMLDLQAGDQKKPDYLALNPNGVVPTLVVDGTPMFEAVAIMQWLGDRYGVDRGLWPAADTPERLTALSWTTWAYVTYGTMINILNYAQSPHADPALHHPPLAKHAQGEFDKLLSRLDARVSERPYLLGDAYSLADMIVASVVTYSTYCGVSLEGHPHVVAWAERFQARPAYRKTWEAAAP